MQEKVVNNLTLLFNLLQFSNHSLKKIIAPPFSKNTLMTAEVHLKNDKILLQIVFPMKLNKSFLILKNKPSFNQKFVFREHLMN